MRAVKTPARVGIRRATIETLERRALLSADLLGSDDVTRPEYTIGNDTNPWGAGRDDLGTAAGAAILPGYQIEVRFPDSSLTASQQAVFTAAAARWQQVLLGDVPTAFYDYDGNGTTDTIDDIVINATAPAIDGAGGILGSAGPTRLRSGTFLPSVGQMRFDSADLANMQANGTFANVILHEMGHVLGLGTNWTNKGLLTGSGTSDPRYTGTAGLAQYQAIFGISSPTGVPVENSGGSGTANAHWRENDGTAAGTFSNELMTGYIAAGYSPISRITIGQWADLGYPSVNINGFDVFSPAIGGGNPYPTIGSLSDSADPVVTNSSFTLTANSVSDNGSVASVSFYRETNGIAGLQVIQGTVGDIAGDTFLSTDNSSAGGFTATVSTSGLSAGTYTYYAQALDNQNLVSVNATTPNTVGTLPAWLAVGSVASWNSSTKVLTVTGATTIIADPGSDQPTINVTGATLTINPTTSDTIFHVGSLNLTSNSTATLSASGTGNRVLVIENGSVTLDSGSKLNLTNNALVDQNTNQAGANASHTSLDGAVTSSFHNFAWDLPGITSTTVQSGVTNGEPLTLGVLMNNDGAGNSLFYGDGSSLPKFMGVTVNAFSVMVRATLLGDGTLDREVDSVDFALFQSGYDGSRPYVGFAFGDYNFDNLIDSIDFGLFQAGFDASN